MSNESVAAWKSDVAFLVVQEVPYQTLETGIALADSYLAATGGWIPDDAGDPTGPGQPASGKSQPQAAEAIKEILLERIQNFETEATIRVNFQFFDNFSFDPDTDDSQQAIDAMRLKFRDFIEFQLEDTQLELVELDTYTSDFRNIGLTTAEIRVEIQNTILAGGRIIDPKAIALTAARARWGLDNTWNVEYVYIQEGQELFFMLRKYLSEDYDIVDSTSDKQYAIKLDPVRYNVSGGLIINL